MLSIFSSFELLVKDPLFAIITSIIAILSFILMILFYLKSKYIKEPFYIIKSINLVRDLVSRIEPLEMTFKGKKVSNLTISKLLFWNSGRDTIRSEDIAKADPLIVSIKNDFDILDTNIIYSKNQANSFCITDFNNKQFRINFDFIDKNEGSILQIIHTGTSNMDLKVNGTIKGAGNPIRKHIPIDLIKIISISPLSDPNPKSYFKTLGIGIIIYIVLFFSLLLLSFYQKYSNKLLMLILGILAGTILLGTIILTLLFFIIRTIPRGFESFWEEI